MLKFLISHQQGIMLFLQGICVFIALLTLITKNLGARRKAAIFMLELSAACILGSAVAFINYEGVVSQTAWWCVRVSKFCDYFFSLMLISAMNVYLKDLFMNEGKMEKVPLTLVLADFVLAVGLVLVVLNQWTGFYYTIDGSNHYIRSPGRLVASVIPILAIVLELCCIIPNFSKLSKKILIPIILFIVTPALAVVVQLYIKGFYVTNVSTVGMAIILYIFVIQELNDSVEKAHKREVEILENYKRELELTVEERTHELRIANEKAKTLLLNILPEPVARELTENPDRTISQKYPNATILFTDIVGFTKMSGGMSAEETVAMLNALVSLFDQRAEKEGIEKIKTIGDAYMAAAGLTEDSVNDGAERMIRFAKGLFEDVKTFNSTSPVKIDIRIGINSGDLVAGVIGKTKFIYDVWGDTVNVASRMESTGVPMKVHVSESTFIQTKDRFRYEGPVQVDVKGKGLMNGYFL